MLALIYLQAWSVLLCTHICIRMLRSVNTAYGVKGCVSNTACVIIVTHVVTWFYANIGFLLESYWSPTGVLESSRNRWRSEKY